MNEEKLFFKSFTKANSNLIQCTSCRNYCIIAEKKFGICGVRKNVEGKLVLITKDKPCAVHLDPIEKKPLYHFLPGTKTMSFGFYGCNFHCDFCQNFDISSCKGIELEKAVKGIKTVTPKQAIDLTKSSKAKSIAITYNEPAISIEWDLELFKLSKKLKGKNSLKNIFVSNGYSSKESIKSLRGKLDAINIDLKSFDERFYKNICGANLESVLSCIKEYHSAGVHLELTTLIIPGKNDSFEEINKLTKWIAALDKNIPWHVSAFSPMHKMLSVPATTNIQIRNAIAIGKENGLKYIYGGNTSSNEFSHTYCPKCNSLLIDRTNYSGVYTKDFSKKGKCKNCGQRIKGVFL